MKKLTDLSLFELANEGGDLKRALQNVNLKLDAIPLEELEDQISSIKRKFNYSLTGKVVSEIDSGNVVPVYHEEKLDLPTYIPTYLYNDDGVVKSIVNLTNYGRYDRDDNFQIDLRTLFALLQCGLITRELYIGTERITSKTAVAKNSAMIFAKLVGKLMDKHFAINLDVLKTDTVHFVAAKYFLLNVLERDMADSINSIAVNTAPNETTEGTLLATDEELGRETYEDFDNFIDGLSSIDGLDEVNKRFFLQEWMKSYDESTILSLEYMPMFFHMIFSSMVNAHLNKEFIIDSVAGKLVTVVYNEIARVIK